MRLRTVASILGISVRYGSILISGWRSVAYWRIRAARRVLWRLILHVWRMDFGECMPGAGGIRRSRTRIRRRYSLADYGVTSIKLGALGSMTIHVPFQKVAAYKCPRTVGILATKCLLRTMIKLMPIPAEVSVVLSEVLPAKSSCLGCSLTNALLWNNFFHSLPPNTRISCRVPCDCVFSFETGRRNLKIPHSGRLHVHPRSIHFVYGHERMGLRWQRS